MTESPSHQQTLLERLETFIDDPPTDTRFVGTSVDTSEAFNALALDVHAFQCERIEPIRRLAQSRGAQPGTITDWRQIPPVPVAAFKSMDLAAAPAEEIFRSSGTTRGDTVRSVHHQPFPGLYRRVIERLFQRHCLLPDELLPDERLPDELLPDERRADEGQSARLPMLSLVAPRSQIADSSLGFMVEHLLDRFGAPSSRVAFTADGVDFAAADEWVRQVSRAGEPAMVLGTAFALAWWLEDLERRGESHRLPAGTRLFETGGFKGRSRELTRQELLAGVRRRLGVPAHLVLREYGMSELTGHFYTGALAGGDPDLFLVPHFMRVRALDPETLEDVPDGEPGLLAVFDLANVGAAACVLSEDLGVVEPKPELGPGGGTGLAGFRLVGRAAGAELRGCSLTVDELRR